MALQAGSISAPANVRVDGALVNVQARPGVRAHHEASGADARVAALRVDAPAAVARTVPSGKGGALVDVRALLAVRQELEPGTAGARVGPGHVDAVVVAAAVGPVGTLVNVDATRSRSGLFLSQKCYHGLLVQCSM